MHLEPPEGRLASLKDFARHYGMIVVSILTALGLEAAIEAAHHHQAAEVATQEIQVELRGDLDEVRGSIKENAARARMAHRFSDQIAQALRAGQPLADIRQQLLVPMERDFRLGFSLPTLQREAWERAVTSQAAAHIEPTRMGALSTAYTTMRDTPPLSYQAMNMLVDTRALINAMVDIGLGNGDPVACLHLMKQYEGAVGSVTSNLIEIEATLVAATGAPAIKRDVRAMPLSASEAGMPASTASGSASAP